MKRLKWKPGNPATDEQFISKALLCSILSVIQKLLATGSFHFRSGQAKLSQANFYSIHFLKVRYFPGKTDNKPTNRFLEFHSCSFYPATINFQNSPSSDLYMARDLSRLRRSPDRFAAKKACPRSLTTSLNSIPRWFQWFFRSFVFQLFFFIAVVALVALC